MPPAKSIAKPKPRMRRPPAALRRAAALDPTALRARKSDIGARPDLPDEFAVTSWDIGETYIQASKLHVTRFPPEARPVGTASWNLRWGAARPTARCGQRTLDRFIREHPDLMDTRMWLLEEQFDLGDREIDALRVAADGEVVLEEGGKTGVCMPTAGWERHCEAIRRQVWKGPFMPIYEASVRMAGLARGIEVVDILPRHVKAVFNLPLEGNAANKAVSETFMAPRLLPAEDAVIREAVRRRDRQNAAHGERTEGRRHDADETVMNAWYALSAMLEVDLVGVREQLMACLRGDPPADPLPGVAELLARERRALGRSGA